MPKVISFSITRSQELTVNSCGYRSRFDCTDDDLAIKAASDGTSYVICNKCKAQGPQVADVTHAVSAWNLLNT